jgi:hypothetical protein
VRASSHPRSADSIDYQSARLIFRWRSVPKGSRNKPRRFLADLYADWGQNSLAVIQKFRETCPRVYLKVVASILPKQLEIERDSSMELQTINSLLSDCPTCAFKAIVHGAAVAPDGFRYRAKTATVGFGPHRRAALLRLAYFGLTPRQPPPIAQPY